MSHTTLQNSLFCCVSPALVYTGEKSRVSMWSLQGHHCFYGGFCNGRWGNLGKKTDLPSLFLCKAVPKREAAMALQSLPGLTDMGSYIQNLTEKLSTQEISRAGELTGAALQQLADNLSNIFLNQQNALRQGEFNELLSAFSDALSKLRSEDLNEMLRKFSAQISERNETLTQSGEDILLQIEDAVALGASQLGPLLSETIEKLKTYPNDALIVPNNIPIYLNDALTHLNDVLTYISDVLTHPNDVPTYLNDVPTYLNNALTYLNDVLAYPNDVLSFALGVPHGADSSPFASNIILSSTIGSAFVLLVLGISLNARKSSPLEGRDLPSRYDPNAIETYFRKRLIDIYYRLLQVVYELSSFIASLLIDKMTGSVKENEKVRATELVGLIAKLGPTAIKIGQALSIRPDILPVAYLEELQKLQDRVPPFSNEEAKKLILEGLGKPVEEVFTEFSTEPIAAASLGQVYKAKLRESGDIVAVKVQRPGVLEGICRDLYLLRSGAQIAQSIPNVRSNLVALLDNWAFRFFDEIDYVREGENALQFAKNMETSPNIVVPAVYMQYTSRKVLTMQWVEGEKLSESKAEDLLQLVKVALNCYLMQLLESGFLHADPHPGNLLRTQNGCLCVLDYGLMTQITLDQQYAFIDYIAHLVNADYALVAEDLVKLGFVPPELVDPAKTASVVPQLSRVLGELVQGGGARKVNFQQITDDLSTISRDYVFVIPPYFALILRAFSVLEGIGLAADPDYAIINDCYPYLCKRLITDDSPRTRAALKYFVYAGKEQLDVTRAENIISGFQTFQTLTAVTPVKSGNSNRLYQSSVDLAAKQVLYLVFAPNGSYLQELLLTELVRAVDALSRDAVAEIWQYFASRALVSLPPAFMAPKSWPIPLPGLFFGASRVATLSAEDQQSLEAVKRLWVLLEPQFIQRPEMREAAGSMIPLISDLFPGLVNTSQRFFLMLLQRQALRLADDLDGKQSVAEWDRNPSAFARRVRPLMRGA